MSNFPASFNNMSYDQHFNISEIYLHPSHTKRKHASNVQNASPNEDNDFKDIALLQISYLKHEKSYLKSIKATQIQTIPNRKRMKQIINRGGKMSSFVSYSNILDKSVGEVVHHVECDSDFNKVFGKQKFRCHNQTNRIFNNTKNSTRNNIPDQEMQVLEGFPLVVLFPKLRHRQNSAVVGCKTSKVKYMEILINGK